MLFFRVLGNKHASTGASPAVSVQHLNLRVRLLLRYGPVLVGPDPPGLDAAPTLCYDLLVACRRIAHLTKVLTRDVDQLFDSVSLNVLLDLRGTDGVLQTAGEFYGLCENFSLAVESRSPLPEMREDYQFLVASWPELVRCFRYARQPEVIRSLSSIEDSFVTLQDAIGIAPHVDWHAAADRAAACARLAERLNGQLQRYVLQNSRYDRTFRRRAGEHMTAFRGSIDQLHQRLVDRRAGSLEAECVQLATAWSQLNIECLRKLGASDKQYFAPYQPRITERVVRLQAMLQL